MASEWDYQQHGQDNDFFAHSGRLLTKPASDIVRIRAVTGELT